MNKHLIRKCLFVIIFKNIVFVFIINNENDLNVFKSSRSIHVKTFELEFKAFSCVTILKH